MTYRSRISAAVITAVVGIAGVTFMAWPAPTYAPGVTKENFARIRIGMRHEEVHAIFGKPCGGIFHYASGTTVGWTADEPFDDIHVAIYIDDGRVCGKRWGEEPESILNKISCWIRSLI